MTSQADQILEMLQAGEEVSPLSVFDRVGSLACHSRIAELRERGYIIDCEIVHKGRVKYGSYTLRQTPATTESRAEEHGSAPSIFDYLGEICF